MDHPLPPILSDSGWTTEFQELPEWPLLTVVASRLKEHKVPKAVINGVTVYKFNDLVTEVAPEGTNAEECAFYGVGIDLYLDAERVVFSVLKSRESPNAFRVIKCATSEKADVLMMLHLA